MYRAWRLQADHDYLRVQLERQGRATVVRLGERRRLLTITELPELGDADPFYGTFGGGFPFCLRPTRYDCRLVVEARLRP